MKLILNLSNKEYKTIKKISNINYDDRTYFDTFVFTEIISNKIKDGNSRSKKH